MSIENLQIIGERIKPGFRSTKLLFDNEDVDGLPALALALKKPEFMVEVIKAVQGVDASASAPPGSPYTPWWLATIALGQAGVPRPASIHIRLAALAGAQGVGADEAIFHGVAGIAPAGSG